MATLNPSKKEAGIFRCFKDDQVNIHTYPDTEYNALQELGRISQRNIYQPLSLTNLPPMSNEEIQKLQKLMSKDKAITIDGISDTFIRKTKNLNILKDLWNVNTRQINKYNGQARVVPLNNVCSQNSNLALSHYLAHYSNSQNSNSQARFKNFCQQHLKYEQNDFISNRGTQVNIEKLISYLDSVNRKERKKVIQILEEKQVLNLNELTFLKGLPYQRKKKWWCKDEVDQGSPLSPSLFNIYLDAFLQDLSLKLNQELNVRSPLKWISNKELSSGKYTQIHISPIRIQLFIQPIRITPKNDIINVQRNLQRSQPDCKNLHRTISLTYQSNLTDIVRFLKTQTIYTIIKENCNTHKCKMNDLPQLNKILGLNFKNYRQSSRGADRKAKLSS
ncbi:unnamed protein product [Paramecium octaurelia]|uniref:Reverse transcriptase domain-containing protein n=1 Tax=Paramecium octaurelia TaxID=43137 RepID=A0A8S1XXV9_PAROT|nr:unnamed protein product [Paramecium octaurelia]